MKTVEEMMKELPAEYKHEVLDFKNIYFKIN